MSDLDILDDFDRPDYVDAPKGRNRWRAPGETITHCKMGHPYTPENRRINTAGAQVCRACLRARDRARYRRQKAARP